MYTTVIFRFLISKGSATTGENADHSESVIAAVCEARGILTAWHGPGNISPVTHMANAHVSLAVPNFGIQEFDANWDDRIEEVFSTVPAYADGHVTVPLSTGLGIDVDIDAARQHPYVRRMRPTVRRGDGTPWAY